MCDQDARRTDPVNREMHRDMAVHPTAILTGEVELAGDVDIGPFVVIRGPVTIGKGTVIEERASIVGPTRIGQGNRICCGAVVGGDPQDLSFVRTNTTHLEIGDHNTIREYATIHRGATDGSRTIVGSHNFFMALSHVGHDCCIHDHVIVANGSLLAGHVELFDRAIVSGQVAVHQFARIGRLGMVAGLSRVARDVPPFMIVLGESAVLGPNVVGLRRAGMSAETRRAIRSAFRTLYRSALPLSEAVEELAHRADTPEVIEIVDFIKASRRGICSHRRSMAHYSRTLDGDAEDKV